MGKPERAEFKGKWAMSAIYVHESLLEYIKHMYKELLKVA